MKTINFISGLPQSGGTLIGNILKQNPDIHAESASSLRNVFEGVRISWNNMPDKNTKVRNNVLKSILNGYYEDQSKPIIFDKNSAWVTNIGMLENLLQKQVKVLVPVRNPAEIISSFEKTYRENSLDIVLPKAGMSIAARAYYYAQPEGLLGTAHTDIKDAITSNYKDRLLFVEYNRYCNSPKSQTKRIYDFFEIPSYDHDFTSIKKETINCVNYIGLNLFEQYNREIFWNAWI